jgi:hypothetical protein
MLVLLFETMRLPNGILRQLGLLAVILVTFGGMAVWVAMNAPALEQEPRDQDLRDEDDIETDAPVKPRWRARSVRTHDVLK